LAQLEERPLDVRKVTSSILVMPTMKRKTKKKEPTLPQWEEPEYSFDLDTILFLHELEWETRMKVEERMVEIAENKKCIPLSVAKKALKQIEKMK
jgi:hypothetical protein